jgi:DNA-binding transcriptional ArsR family regulator
MKSHLQRFLNRKRGITKKTTVKRPTVSQVLSKLLELEKIERIGLGRGTRYRIK